MQQFQALALLRVAGRNAQQGSQSGRRQEKPVSYGWRWLLSSMDSERRAATSLR